MDQFLGTYENRLDAKGRVSIPAQFRTVLRDCAEGDGPLTLILRRSHKFPCVEGWPPKRFAALEAPLTQLDQFSDAHDDLTTSIYANAFPVEADKEGRIMLGEAFIAHAGLSGQVAFMGAGKIFQMWEPAAAERRRNEADIGARSVSVPGFVTAAPAAAA